MKKKFTLLVFLVVTVNAAAQYNGYLNVGDPDEVHFIGNYSTYYLAFSEQNGNTKGVVKNGRLNVCGYPFYNVKNSTSMRWWIDKNETTIYYNKNSNWSQQDVFQGADFFFGASTTYCAYNNQQETNQKVTFYITNCSGIAVFLKNENTTSGTFSIKATPKAESSNTFDGESKNTSETLTTNQACFPSLSGLDKTKIYKIELTIPAKTYFYEISFLINNFEPSVANINDNNWGTMYLDYPVRIPKNEHSTLHAYTIEGIGDDNKVTLGEVSNYIPANTGVLLWEEEPNDKPIIFTETGKNIAEISENWLKGTTADNFTVGDALYGKPSTAKVLTLGRSGGKLGFFIYNGSLGKNKAYLLYDYGADSPINVKGFYISGFDDMTDIQTVESESTETGNWYSLQGVRLNARPMQRGIYLNNGKKVFVK